MQLNSPLARKQRFISSFLALLMSASLMLSSFAAVPVPQAVQTGSVPAQAPDPARVNYHLIVYKLKATSQIGAMAALPSVQGLDAKPLFTTQLPAQPSAQASAQAASAYNPRLDLYYRIQLDPQTSPADAQKVLDGLKADPNVALAYFEPVYLPASVNKIETDHTDEQIYLNSAEENGIDARYAWTLAGGRGLAVQLIDVEAGWQIGHEDLNISNSSLIESANASDQTWVDHGTAVVGVIAARRNSIGVTGIAPDTEVRLVSTISFITADAILKAAANLEAGDVLVIPLQLVGPQTGKPCPAGCDCTKFESVPVEWTQANFDAIYAATQMGIIVVEAAGDGGMNLDDDLYKGLFKRSFRDSGAIIVAAGDSSTREPTACTDYGKRVDLQGWGNNVVSTGYGDLEQGQDANGNPDPKQTYTASFGGTSAATAMVAGAVTSLQGVAKARGYTLTPDLVRSILKSTGQPQGGDPLLTPIGRLPNLKDAIDKKLSNGVQQTSPFDGETLNTLRPTLSWQSFLGATQYELIVSVSSNFSTLVLDKTLTTTEYTLPDNLSQGTNGKSYYWKVRAFVNDAWQTWALQPWMFTVKAFGTPGITLVKPVSGSLNHDLDPAFNWKKPSTTYTGGYEFQISTDYDFSTGDIEVVDDPDGNVDYHSISAPLLENTRYFWHVRSRVTDSASNTSVGAWSSRWTLYTTLDVSGVTASVTGNPDSLRPTFDWDDVNNARSYQFQASTNSNYSSPFKDVTIGIPSGSLIPTSEYKLTSDLPRGKTIYWRVRARGTYGWSAWVQGDALDPRNPPYTPALVSPADKAVVREWQGTVTFKWNKPSTSGPLPNGGYTFELSTKSDFSDIVNTQDIADPDTTSVDVAGVFDPETIYYWHVRANGDEGTGSWSATRKFYTTPPAPAGLAVVSQDTLRPVLTWNVVDVARSYQVQVARDDTFGSTKIVTTVTTYVNPPYTLTATLPRSKTLYWRVRAGGLYGYSNWSDSTTVDTPNPPTVPSLNSPANGANILSFTPTLDWSNSAKISGNPDSNPTGYQVQVATVSNFDAAKVVIDETVATSQYAITGMSLPNAGTYYWRVRAVNAANEFSVWTPVYSFTTPAQIKGKIVDAENTSTNLQNVVVQVGGRSLQVNSNDNGEYVVRGLLPGDYSLTSSLPGYGRQVVSFSVGYGTNLTRNFQLVRLPNDGQIRLVVYWNGTPSDMDAHLWLPSTHPYHISKNNVGDINNPAIRAEIDVTNANGFGPEVITLGGYFSGVYTFGVYMNADPDVFVTTRARVFVYEGSTLKANIAVPDTGVGHWWKVLSINIKNPDPANLIYTLNIHNIITDQEPKPAGY